MTASTFIKLCFVSCLGILTVALPSTKQGLAQTPTMGWSSYQGYSCTPNETLIQSNAQALVDMKLAEAGYKYVLIDCGWSASARTSNNSLTWNPSTFPAGPFGMHNFLHRLKLKFGINACSGIQQCGYSAPGSLGNETLDVGTFLSWNIDLLKYDSCYSDPNSGYPMIQYTPSVTPYWHFQAMAIALGAAPIVYQVFDMGVDWPAGWNLGNSWQVASDISQDWESIRRILNQAVPQTSFAGKGRWLHLDLLLVGLGCFSIPEEQTQFSLWSILKSPLMISAVLNDGATTINQESLDILLNTRVISYNQDTLGIPATFRRRWPNEGYELWSGPLSGGRTVAALVNLDNSPKNLTLDLPDAGLQSAGTVHDVWANSVTKNVLTSYSASVEGHGTLLLELSDTATSGQYGSNFIKQGPKVSGNHNSTFFPVYGITTSIRYSMIITFPSSSKEDTKITISSSNQNATDYTLPRGSATITVPVALRASNNNYVSIISPSVPICINITMTNTIFYPAWSFDPQVSFITLDDCLEWQCNPVLRKIKWISGTTWIAQLYVPTPSLPDLSGPRAKKFVNIYFCNNDIAFTRSYYGVTSTRNLSISVNGTPLHAELPLAGKHSELYGPGWGWYDTGVFGVLLDNWNANGNLATSVNNFQIGGDMGWAAWSQHYAVDIVGIEVFM